MAAQDPEHRSFQYRVDLVAFAKRAGYEARAHVGDGLTLLEHPNRDRVVVARCPDGGWIYASANRYEAPGPDETPAEASRRLRDCIARTKDKGTIVEFVRARDCAARTPPVSLDCVRERLRDYLRKGASLDFHGALHPPPEVLERSHTAQEILSPPNDLRSPGPTQQAPGALDPPKDRLTKAGDACDRAHVESETTPPRVLVVTESPAHAALYYEQHGRGLGHTNANAAYVSVGAERPRGAGWDLTQVGRALAAMPSGGAVVAALSGPPTGDRLAQELRAHAARKPEVTFVRHTLRLDRDKTRRAPEGAMAPSRGR